MKKYKTTLRTTLRTMIMALAAVWIMSGCDDDRPEAFAPDLALNNETITVSSGGSRSNVLVFSNTTWTVELEDDSQIWITLLDGDDPVGRYTGNGRNYFTFATENNDTGAAREADFVISTGGTTKKLKIKQGI